MHILITGGAGFIGHNLAKRLLHDGHRITILDNFYTSCSDNIEVLSEKIKFYNIDLSDENNINEISNLVSDVDVVYHLAASIGVKLVQNNMSKTLHNSLKINDILFPIFQKYNVKVIFSSTSEVYGETTEKSGSKETDVLKILPPGKPRGSYACSKLLSEFLIKSYTFKSVIVRFFNIVGTGQVSDYGHVLPKFIELAKKNEPITVFHDGQMIRSYCDIRDAIEMLALLLDDEHDGHIYNIGSSCKPISVLDLAKNVIEISNSKSKIKFIPFNEALGVQFEEIFVRFPNTEKINKFYTCKYTLEDTIRSLI